MAIMFFDHFLADDQSQTRVQFTSVGADLQSWVVERISMKNQGKLLDF